MKFLGITVISLVLLTGCVGEVSTSCTRENLIGTWESGTVNGYYIHQKILESDGTYQATWYYEDTREVYSRVDGTWELEGDNLKTTTTHLDTYPITCVDSNTIQLQIDDESRTYYRV